jgi:hypothetical protein
MMRRTNESQRSVASLAAGSHPFHDPFAPVFWIPVDFIQEATGHFSRRLPPLFPRLYCAGLDSEQLREDRLAHVELIPDRLDGSGIVPKGAQIQHHLAASKLLRGSLAAFQCFNETLKRTENSLTNTQSRFANGTPAHVVQLLSHFSFLCHNLVPTSIDPFQPVQRIIRPIDKLSTSAGHFLDRINRIYRIFGIGIAKPVLAFEFQAGGSEID